MMMFVFSSVCVLALTALVENAQAMSDAHKAAIHEHMMGIAMECMKSNPLAEDEVSSLQAKKLPDTETARCFVACMFKNAGMMDETGNMSGEGALAAAEKMFSDAPEQVDNIRDFLHMCKDVNSKPVGDGAAGCDRAKHAFMCMTEHASKFGFDM